jgi:hypothetical protein
MAGGKETPRQKLIGLMYLVLTALLALNVSKQILDAFVAIEENIQKGSVTQYERGEAAKQDLITELKTTLDDEAGRAKIAKIKKYLNLIELIDKETGEFIFLVDEIKKELIGTVEGKEKLKVVKDKDIETIIWRDYDKSKPLLPVKFNLMAIEKKDEFDVPMHHLVGKDINNVTAKEGLKLWQEYNDLRNFIVNTAGTYTEGSGKKWSLKIGKEDTKKISSFTDFQSMEKLIRESFKKYNVNPDDVEALVLIFQEMTKKEKADHGDKKNLTKNVHWLGRTFDHSPLVGAIASLSSLQNEALSARAKAVNLLKAKISTGEYSFNKIKELVSGPGVATAGDDIELFVTMAAYDSDKNPIVKSNTGTIETKDGIAKIKARASGSNMKFSGTVQTFTKNGTPTKAYPWEWEVQIAKPQGSISSPELAVIYQDYDNVVVPSAAGYTSTVLMANGATVPLKTINVKGSSYTAGVYKTSQDRGEVKFAVYGVTGSKRTKLNEVTYRVRPFPKADVTTTNLKKGQGGLVSVALPDGVPLTASFVIESWELTDGMNNSKGTGKVIPGSNPVLSRAKIGQQLILTVKYKRVGSAKTITRSTPITVN